MPAPELLTPRLRLRPWRDDDAPAFAALNMTPKCVSREENSTEETGASISISMTARRYFPYSSR